MVVILPLKKRVHRDKCSFATKQCMFGVFAIDEILRYRGTRFPGSRTLCHPGLKKITFFFALIGLVVPITYLNFLRRNQNMELRLEPKNSRAPNPYGSFPWQLGEAILQTSWVKAI